jgi:hypothetical protein
MFADRSSQYHPGNGFHSGRGRVHGLGGRFDEMLSGGWPSLSGRHRSGRESMGWGRDPGLRLQDTPLVRRRRGSMNESTDGIGDLNLGGGGRRPFMPRSSLGSRGSSLFSGRSPLDDDLFSIFGGRRGSLLGRGMGMGLGLGGGLNSRDGLLGLRSPLLGGGLLGAGSRVGSSRGSGIFDLQAIDRSRVPYRSLVPYDSNYRQPYVEDYFSEVDPEELLRLQEMDRRGLLFWDDLFDDGLML